MALKVTRYGGPMAGMKPKTKVFEIEDLDAPTKNALKTLLDKPAASPSERIPDSFVYSFEVDGLGANKEVEVSGTHVPGALRKLLP